ncbi:3-isopropylmalate dehydratase small subunit [Sporomusa acidovorans]|uniref:2,3-dimethylmalate dehydratase small subunit n=1 Tax=Sporomusa acidovorans (strain ATCC 49682 / DSM 3132 / Mol) TaxID=1123286 RepID=A0ABZ3J2N7_SPOA4|nr:3-isopropylmalate dehydratase small subunit [Sporomusa acidovorans]OZC19962.1 2,3-dimethylmalate dehydratase small subunit [Sporomusa acidovorans DSM 3132]SDD48973.1 3-isopropylmalate/(R)-2-methylmalate dehydratase small subunit [Sporomusa acidovorans]
MDGKLTVCGRVWCLGDNIDTDQILPGYAMAYPQEQLKFHALAGSAIPDFASRVNAGDIIIAGNNFGAGSSREQAPVALQAAGVGAIIARSFARIFRRNSINIGLPIMAADIIGKVKNGDEIIVDLAAGEVTLPDKTVIRGQRPGDNVLAILQAGGLIPKVRQQLQQEREE